MEEHFATLVREMTTAPGAAESALAELREKVGIGLPADYLAFLRWSNGAAGTSGENYIEIWTAEEVASDSHLFEESVPEILFIAGDGAEAVFGFDTRVLPMPIVITHQDDLALATLVTVAPSFTAFLEFLAANDWITYWSEHHPTGEDEA